MNFWRIFILFELWRRFLENASNDSLYIFTRPSPRTPLRHLQVWLWGSKRIVHFWSRNEKIHEFSMLDLVFFRILAPCINIGTVDHHAPWAVSDVGIGSRWRQIRLETLCAEANRLETEVVTRPEVSLRGSQFRTKCTFDEYSMPYSIKGKSLDIDTWLGYVRGRFR